MDLILPVSRYLFRPLYAWRNHDSDYKYVATSEAAQYLTKSDMEEQRVQALKALLIHARNNSQFYERRFAEAGFVPEQLTAIEQMRTLPTVSKRDIQLHWNAMLARNMPRSSLIANRTGGSTGSPLEFYHDPECMYRRRASTIRHDRWAGLEIWDKAAAIWGNRRDFLPATGWMSKVRDRFIDRRVVLDASGITGKKLSHFVDVLRREQPTVYVAYANSVYLLARYIRETGVSDYSRPLSIITSAELLTQEQRNVIEAVFDCPVFDRYGCREVSVIASECDRHEGLHLCSDRLIVEFLKGERNAQPGELAKIVITDLFNYGMPFIRYDVEDFATPIANNCSCGRNLPLMRMMGGRVTDFLVTPEGTVVSGAAMTIYFVATVTGIAQAQIVQTERNVLNIRVVKKPVFNDQSETEIKKAVNLFFGPAMKYDIEFVDAIPAEPSGKFRFSICNLDPLEFLT